MNAQIATTAAETQTETDARSLGKVALIVVAGLIALYALVVSGIAAQTYFFG